LARLVIDGLVEQPMSLSLADKMSPGSQSTLHACIQGWRYFASWTGVPIADLLDAARPSSEARYLVFHTLDEKWEVPGHGNFYEVIDLETARRPQVILAYEMNGAPLPIAHGAPLRLRVEHQLGYKMAKWVTRIELVADFRGIGKGQGGWRDDLLDYYPSDAGIRRCGAAVPTQFALRSGQHQRDGPVEQLVILARDAGIQRVQRAGALRHEEQVDSGRELPTYLRLDVNVDSLEPYRRGRGSSVQRKG
jgi:DMSO/TMAO reductase YedYZ molybdopterin-dependent catalytic subunit